MQKLLFTDSNEVMVYLTRLLNTYKPSNPKVVSWYVSIQKLCRFLFNSIQQALYKHLLKVCASLPAPEDKVSICQFNKGSDTILYNLLWRNVISKLCAAFPEAVIPWKSPWAESKCPQLQQIWPRDLQLNKMLSINVKSLFPGKLIFTLFFQFYKRSVRKEYEQHWDEEVNIESHF